MSKKHRALNVLIAAGGTGGHIFPAIAVAQSLKKNVDKVNILFVGSKYKMEMQLVGKYGYNIKGLPIIGFKRKKIFSNIKFLWLLFRSTLITFFLFFRFRPKIIIGFGGYPSLPILLVSRFLNKKYYLQEQNAFPGMVNKMMAGRAQKIFTAFQGQHPFYKNKNILNTGNPVRKEIYEVQNKKKETIFHQLDLVPSLPLVLIMGGSLGAKPINITIEKIIHDILKAGIQVVWQTGKKWSIDKWQRIKNLKVFHFIDQIENYMVFADLVIARAGAITIAELCILKKMSILVPSPYVTDDHQKFNAQLLHKKKAALMLQDHELASKLFPTLIGALKDEALKKSIHEGILKFRKPHSQDIIVKELLNNERA